MFGLTFEKLIIIGVIAAFVIGPERLPHYASVLAKFVRQLRDFANGAKSRMKEEMGPDFDEVEWKKLDPRQYDPRRIIRDALLEDPADVAAPPVKPSSPMAAGAAAGGLSAASMAAGGSPGSGSGVTLDKFAPPGADGAATAVTEPLAAEAGFDDGPGISLTVPAGSVSGAGAGPDYLSGRKTLERESAPQPALAAPHDSEAT